MAAPPAPVCRICGSHEWMDLPDPAQGRSITTAGLLVPESLGKSQCAACGMVQRIRHDYLADSDYYERHYAGYHRRPGNAAFNSSRYRLMAQWISESIGAHVPRSILEAGCGQGSTLREIRLLFPEAIIEGLEPSVEDAEEVQKLGFRSYAQKLDETHEPDRKYDLVFSNHVLQHTSDPIAFLRAMEQITEDDGLVVVIVQDASNPTNELLYSDQNFSFLPQHLERLAQAAGLRLLSWTPAPVMDELRFSQLMVCGKQATRRRNLCSLPPPVIDQAGLMDLYRKRIHYLGAWARIEDYLKWKTQDASRVYNFGGGMFTYLLACYCDAYWERVTRCVVDGASGRCLDKEVVPFNTLSPRENECLVLGTRPAMQNGLAARLSGAGWNAVRWDNFVEG